MAKTSVRPPHFDYAALNACRGLPKDKRLPEPQRATGTKSLEANATAPGLKKALTTTKNTGLSLMKKRILIIDDSEAICTTLLQVIERAEKGFEIHTATSGSDAVAIVDSSNIDLVITDIFMSDKDGLEIIKELKEKFPTLKIIAISGGGILKKEGIEYLKLAKKLGAHYTLPKPFSGDELMVAIHHVMQ